MTASCNPKISLIVPVYNVEAYLDECLDSLCSQTFSDIEIICVDDGSTDGSPALLDARAARDGRIRAVHQENAGAAAARNHALDLVRGEYVMFVDSDDLIAARSCEVLYARAQETGADIVVFGGKTFPTELWADFSFAQREKVYRHDSVDALLSEAGSAPLMCNKLYATRLLNGGDHPLRFNDRLVLGEDNAFQFAVFPRAEVIAYTPDKLYYYRGRADGAVNSQREDHDRRLFLHFDVVRTVFKEWEGLGLLAEWEKQLVEWALRFLFNDASLASFNVRARFSAAFNEFFAPRIPNIEAMGLDGGMIERFEFMRDAQHAAEVAPRCAVLVDSLDGSDEIERAVESIAFQTEQAIEILVLEPRRGGEAFSAAARAFAEKDCRVRILPTRDACAVMASVRAPWLLCVEASTECETTLVRQLLSAAGDDERADEPRKAGGDAQVVTFTDSANALGDKELFSVFSPQPSDDLSALSVVPASRLSGRALELGSLAVSNKLVRTAHLAVVAEETNPKSIRALLSCAFVRAERILPTRRPCLTLGVLRFPDASSARDAARDLIAELEESGRLAGEGEREGFCCAAALHVVAFLSLIRTRAAFEAACGECAPWLQGLLGSEGVDRLADEGRVGDDTVSLLRALCERSSEECLDAFGEELAERLIDSNRANLLAVGEQAGRADALAADIEEFYESVSYRTGRLVTYVPRKAVSLLKRVIRH